MRIHLVLAPSDLAYLKEKARIWFGGERKLSHALRKIIKEFKEREERNTST